MNFPWKYYRALILIAIVPRRTTGVSHGEDAFLGEFQYAVALVHPSCCEPFCTGALIDPSHVLTSGHCVSSLEVSRLEAAAGVVDWGSNIWGEFRSIETIHVHPRYKPGIPDASFLTRCTLFACDCLLGPPRWKLIAKNDIAVLTLDSSFTTGYNIGLVSLPELDAPPPYGTNCVFAGWGRYGFKNDSCLLRWMEFEILEAAECKNKGRHLRNKGEICAIHDNEIAYTEPGDSGGALVCNGVVIGVLQSGGRDGRDPATFPLVSHYIPFIEHACRN